MYVKEKALLHIQGLITSLLTLKLRPLLYTTCKRTAPPPTRNNATPPKTTLYKFVTVLGNFFPSSSTLDSSLFKLSPIFSSSFLSLSTEESLVLLSFAITTSFLSYFLLSPFTYFLSSFLPLTLVSLSLPPPVDEPVPSYGLLSSLLGLFLGFGC